MFRTVLFLFVAGAYAQSFEVASVKPSTSPTARSSIQAGGEQLTMTNVTLAAVILRAFDLKPYQLAGPDWLSARRYDVVAKLPPGARREQSNAMLRGLLGERFRLVARHEDREIRGFELLPGKGGPKLIAAAGAAAEAAPESGAPPQRDANGFPILTAPGWR